MCVCGRGREEGGMVLIVCSVFSALIGASIFISTVVLGTIILIVEVKPGDIGELQEATHHAVA